MLKDAWEAVLLCTWKSHLTFQLYQNKIHIWKQKHVSVTISSCSREIVHLSCRGCKCSVLGSHRNANMHTYSLLISKLKRAIWYAWVHMCMQLYTGAVVHTDVWTIDNHSISVGPWTKKPHVHMSTYNKRTIKGCLEFVPLCEVKLEWHFEPQFIVLFKCQGVTSVCEKKLKKKHEKKLYATTWAHTYLWVLASFFFFFVHVGFVVVLFV